MGSVLADMLRLLHPVVPFVTEALWARLLPPMTALGLWYDEPPASDLLIRDRYPTPRRDPQPEIEARFAILQRFVVAVRQLRAASNIKDNIRVEVQVKPLNEATRPMLEQAKEAVTFLAKLEGIGFAEQRDRGMAAQYDPDFELYIDLSKYIDLKEEVARLDKEIQRAEKEAESAAKTLSNPNFVNKAPPDKVAFTREKQAQAEARLGKLKATRAELAETVGA